MNKLKFKIPELNSKLIISIFIYVLIAGVGYSVYKSVELQKSFFKLSNKVDSLTNTTSNLSETLDKSVYNDHLALLEAQRLKNKANSLETELEALKAQPNNQNQVQINEVYTGYQNFNDKLARNVEVGIDSSVNEDTLNSWGRLVLEGEYGIVKTEIQEKNILLDTTYDEYLASLPPPPTSGEGYSYQNVTTERGTFGVYLIKMNLNNVTVKTVSAWENDCSDNCPTKSLQDYINENGAYAGMNGSYFCPPDYSSCSGKVNSFDYAFYDSNDSKWYNKNALTWFDTGMFTFSSGDSDFYSETSDYSGGGVGGAISNYPSLVKNGDVIVEDDDLTSYQKDVRGPRGALGVDGDNNIYLAIVTGATVRDAAYTMKALGVKYALNLDGGGSSSMFINGGYVVGPGRSLPNAVVLVK